MTTVLIIVCIVFCVAVVLGTLGHFGFAIVGDKAWRIRIQRHHAARRAAITRRRRRRKPDA